jgi:hypothetical protein
MITGITSVFLAFTAHAEGISIEPGQWEMTSTMTMSMMPDPQTSTVQECIEKGILNPEAFNMDQDNPCAITDVTIDGDTARWAISCPTPGGPVMEGHWEMTSHGDSIDGKGLMSTEISGQKMSFDMTWAGKRTGECKKSG